MGKRSLGRTTPREAELKQYTIDYAEQLGLDPNLLMAVIKQESNYKLGADSGTGAIGVAQITGETAKDMAKRFGIKGDIQNDPLASIEGAANQLVYLSGKFDSPKAVLGAYNMGAGAVNNLLKKYPNLSSDEVILKAKSAEGREYPSKVLGIKETLDKEAADRYAEAYPTKLESTVDSNTPELISMDTNYSLASMAQDNEAFNNVEQYTNNSLASMDRKLNVQEAAKRRQDTESGKIGDDGILRIVIQDPIRTRTGIKANYTPPSK
jgi:soluble lytic murein transglycosylase